MDYKHASDSELWQCCRQDDIRAYNKLFDRYVGKLHRMGRRYVKDECTVEELTTDILLSLWVRRHEIILQGNLSAYLFQAMHNKAVSYLRKRVSVTVEIGSLPEDTLVADGNADQQLIANDVLRSFERTLEQLSPQRQKVFRLSREQDMSYIEIACEMNLSPNTVKNHMNAALEYLRHQFKSATVQVITFLFLFFI